MMKPLMATLMLLFSIPAFAGDQYLVRVEGMACPFCAHGVEKKVRAMAGVASATVDLETSTVLIEMADGATLPETAVRKAITDAGFSFKSVAPVADQPAQEHGPDDGRQ